VGAGPDEALLPWLLRRTNQLFIGQVRSALSFAGFSDLSQRGMWAVHALLGQARSASELVDLLRVTKQAVSPLVEELVVSGYVHRDADPGDRRRTLLQLTPRGTEAARVIERGCAEVEAEFVGVVGAAELARLRRTLEQLLRRAGPDEAD
jgi:DNA-binding MarR family transcriptional regulator